MKSSTVLKYVNNTITILMSIIAGIFAYADQIQPLIALSPQLAAKWPVILPAIAGFRALLSMLGDLLDDGKINQSFKALAIIGAIGSIFVFSMMGRFAA